MKQLDLGVQVRNTLMLMTLSHTVQSDSFNTDDAFSTDGVGRVRFLKSVCIDLI